MSERYKHNRDRENTVTDTVDDIKKTDSLDKVVEMAMKSWSPYLGD